MILRENENCWQNTHADKVAFLIDAEEYFEAFVHAAQQARRTIYIAGWDFDSRLVLDRRGRLPAPMRTLSGFLDQVVKANPRLQVFVLAWDYHLVFLRERQFLPVLQFGWTSHRRIHFKMDDQHPMGASQHQKFVVIDDTIAFCGGLDLTHNRWDTPAHHPQDPRRTGLDKSPYLPFHDVQMAVAGETARALGELFRFRWQCATGKKAAPPSPLARPQWPAAVRVEIEDCRVAVARTLAAYKGRKAVREIEQLYIDAIEAAERFIYIENQYLTAEKICLHLARRLSQPSGPEIVVVTPFKASGWLEQSTMDSLRRINLELLFKQDRHRRLGVYWPAVGEQSLPVYVHSKLLIADNRLAVVGSANLSNRSMGFDSESCLAVEGAVDSLTAAAIEHFRTRLLAEHLGRSVHDIAAAHRRQGSLIRLIESAGRPERCLKPLDRNAVPVVDGTAWVPDRSFLDPAEPFAFDQVIDTIAADTKPHARTAQMAKVGGILLVLLALAAAWRWTPLAGLLSLERVTHWASMAENAGVLMAVLVGVYVLGGLIFVPVTFMIGATAVVLPTWQSFVCALLGCTLSAWASYWVGRGLGNRMVRRLTGKRLARLNKYLERQGIWTIMVLRNLPIAPYTVVNIVAGTTHIRQLHFLIGTALGMLPGITLITVFTGRVLQLVKKPDWSNILVAVALIGLVGLGYLWMRRRLRENGAA